MSTRPVSAQVITKGSIGCYETLGVAYAQANLDLPGPTTGYYVAACGAVGVAFLLSFKQLGRLFDDVELILSPRLRRNLPSRRKPFRGYRGRGAAAIFITEEGLHANHSHQGKASTPIARIPPRHNSHQGKASTPIARIPPRHTSHQRKRAYHSQVWHCGHGRLVRLHDPTRDPGGRRRGLVGHLDLGHVRNVPRPSRDGIHWSWLCYVCR